MESCFPDTRRAIWAHSYVLWPNKLTSHLSNDDEHHLQKRSHSRLAISLYGWHCNPYKAMSLWVRRPTLPVTSGACPLGSRHTGSKWPISQTREMHLWKRRNWLSRSYYWTQHSQDGPQESSRHCRMGATYKPHTNLSISRVYRVLLIFYPELLKDCSPPTWSHKEDNSLDLGPSTGRSI